MNQRLATPYCTHVLLACWISTAIASETTLIRAFPGAEGFGAATPGGRGGTVHIVTTLGDYVPGQEAPIPGSFRAAAYAKGPRYILFGVGGTIALKADLHIREPYLTVAGQTAPGGGICFSQEMVVLSTHDVVLRHLRFRSGDRLKQEQLSVGVFGGNNSIFDHCSMTWAVDEVMSSFGSVHNLTFQWCTIAEGLSRSFHPKGEHSKGSILNGDGGISIHHCIYAHNSARNPRVDTVVLDFRNNILYNWGYRGGYTTEGPSYVNYIGNYLRAGPSTRKSAATDVFEPGDDTVRIYLTGNYLEGSPERTKHNVLLVESPKSVDGEHFLNTVVVDQPFRVPDVATDDPLVARDRVLNGAGAILPKRDSADDRLMEEIRTGSGRIIDSQDEVGGWPILKSGTTPRDADNDGMPDAWERTYGLSGVDPGDYRIDTDGDGYPNLEEYLNGTDPTVAEIDCGLPAKTFRAVQDLAVARCAQGRAAFTKWKNARELARLKTRKADLQSLRVRVVSDDENNLTVVQLGERAKIKMVRIPNGVFRMGSSDKEGGDPNERPQHEVTISRPFFLATTLTTNRQFNAFYGPTTERRSRKKEETFPVHEVNWMEAVEYCRLLTKKTGRAFRLPTEAEWEYACRAGTTTAFSTGETITTRQANFDGQDATRFNPTGAHRGKITAVATFPPNPWGLFDMHGNQAEYCQDVAYRTYTTEPVTDPANDKPNGARVLRGGKHSSKAYYIRSAYRYQYAPAVGFGFRVLMETD